MLMMNRLTLVYVVLCLIATAVVDVIAYARGGWSATISYLALTRGARHPVLVLATGFLCGHLFVPAPRPESVVGRMCSWLAARPLALLALGVAISRLWAQPTPGDGSESEDAT